MINGTEPDIYDDDGGAATRYRHVVASKILADIAHAIVRDDLFDGAFLAAVDLLFKIDPKCEVRFDRAVAIAWRNRKRAELDLIWSSNPRKQSWIRMLDRLIEAIPVR